MKITIITVSFNSVKTIEKTILSVIRQSYKNIEYIVVDNISTDGSIDIINKYKDFISKIIIEKDSGISEAFNKGLNAATGDFINFQGADDYLWNENVIEKVVNEIGNRKDILFCGRIARITSDEEKIIYVTKRKKFKRRLLLYFMPLPHQALFTPRSFFEKYGMFDTKIIYSMDYELLLRAYHSFPKVVTSNEIIAAWREGGIGQNKHMEILKEYDNIKVKNKIAPSFFLNAIHFWIKFKYKTKCIFLNQY